MTDFPRRALPRQLIASFFALGLIVGTLVPLCAQTPGDSAAVPLASRVIEKTFVDDAKIEHRYRLLLPTNFREDESKQYPLVLFLHGAGERGDDNATQLKHGIGEFARPDRQSQYPCIVIVPQCPAEQKWVSVDWSPKSGKGTFPDQPSPSMKMALGIVGQWIAGGRVDRSRVYVTGISMGGYGTWFASAMPGNPFAAAVPICGGGDPDWVAQYAGMPIWAFHGSADTAVPVGRSREMIEALVAAEQMPQTKYTEYENGAHDVWTETYQRDDLFAWLHSQRK